MRRQIDEEALFTHFGKKPKSALLSSLRAAFREMSEPQRRAVFGKDLCDACEPTKQSDCGGVFALTPLRIARSGDAAD